MTRNQEIAATILEQLGGRRFVAMTGAKNLVAIENGLAMQIGRNAKSVTHIRIVLDLGADLYNVEALRCRGSTRKVVDTAEGLYADNLAETFEHMTGLATSL